MAELLIELFMEEIPARMQVKAAEDIRRLVTAKLTAAGLAFTHAEAHSTPRRLALVVDGLPLRQPDVREERKGPRVGSPEQALSGFLKSTGLTDIAQAEQRDTGKGVFYFAVTEKKGGETTEALPALVEGAIRALAWPKSMRWGGNRFAWVRPLHSILALFDGTALPLSLSLGETVIAAGDTTRGHRFLSPDPFTVSGFADYHAKLRDAHVILDREERKRLILAGAQAAAAAEGLRLKDDPGLLDEVAGLVEWPVVLVGSIDERFMDVPAEVLTVSMRTHQRYFALETADGRLASRFVVVANRPTSDGGAAVIAGNERVLRARLSDARFFWDQDRKIPLADRRATLSGITFHDRLGSVLDRVKRIEALALEIGRSLRLDAATLSDIETAAHLCKADLVSGVVGEFPEVQGLLGGYVARAQGHSAAVADAIADHYRPQGPGDRVPTAPVSIAVALAEKLDTLVCFFAIDEKPTGSRDPFALRRAALGVIRLIVENGLRLRLLPLFDTAFQTLALSLPGLGQAVIERQRIDGSAADDFQRTGDDGDDEREAVHRQSVAALASLVIGNELLNFFADRLKVSLKEAGTRHDLVDAVFALGEQDDLVLLLRRVEALSAFVVSEDGSNLLVAYRRAANILRAEEKKDGDVFGEPPETHLLRLEEEIELAHAIESVTAQAGPLLVREDYAGAMAILAQLRVPVDGFFAGVTVNAPDPELRVNRLRFLAEIRRLLNSVADFSRVEG
jgi:glycyl-tRNA synthetase beta chain